MEYRIKGNIIYKYIKTGGFWCAVLSVISISAVSADWSKKHQSALMLPVISSEYVLPPDVALNLTSLNSQHFVGKENVKSHSPSQYYMAKTVIYPKRMFRFASDYYLNGRKLAVADSLRKVAESLPVKKIIQLPAHQFEMGNEMGNRIIIYGGKDELTDGPGHEHIDRLTHDVGMPLVKIMTHFNKAQGGSLAHIFSDGNGGMTHAGGLYPGWLRGKPVAVRSEWPADYGTLDDDNVNYNAHLLAIDYQAGTSKVIPDRVLANYHKNFAMWDVFTGIMIPFAEKSQFKEYRDYSFNPLEMTDANDMQRLATVTSTLDKEKISFTSYCSEGQWNVANLAANIFIKKGYSAPFDHLIASYKQAPAYKIIPEDQRQKFPEIGWKWLRDKALITEDQYKNVVETRRYAVYLDWIDDQIQPWTAYDPVRKDGLIAAPMSLGKLVQMLLRSYYPRENVVAALTKEIISLYQTGDEAFKSSVNFLVEQETFDMAGQEKLIAVITQLVSMELAYVLQTDIVKESLFRKLGYEHIINNTDKQKVEMLYDKYIQLIMDASLPRSDFENMLDNLDLELTDMTVKMKVYGPQDRAERTQVADTSFFMWAAPQSWVFWEKYPAMFDSPAVRYVATAMHYSQSQAATDEEDRYFQE